MNQNILTETMQIESFVCDETVKEHPEVSDEVRKMIEEMGLEGQKEMMVGDTDQETRIPFRTMTTDEEVTYLTLCPIESKLENYKGSPIPFRVLEIAKLAQESGYFEKIMVWDRESAVLKDPVLVGFHKVNSYTWTKFILARWGSELENFQDLLEKAKKMVKEEKLQKYQSILAEVKGEIEKVKAGDFEFSRSMPSYYGR